MTWLRALLAAVWLLCTVPALADQLAFGTFRSESNAVNWAQKLKVVLDTALQVSQVAAPDGVMYRVHSESLGAEQFAALQRRARGAGIASWRLVSPGAQPRVETETAVGAAEPQSAPQTSDPVRSGNPIPRLSAPNAVAAPAQQPRPQADAARNSWDGDRQLDMALQSRMFGDTGAFGQNRLEGSVSFELDFFRGWDNDSQSITFNPFLRLDSADGRRTHGDVRDLYYSRVGQDWDLHAGVKRVFWGVTEFHHLVDIINQTDLVENIDGEDKLGQPMVQFTLVRDWGILDVFALPGFRERTFAGSDGRLRLPMRVTRDADYESGAEDVRVDGALRWSHNLGPFEVGLHHFSGTSRDPLFSPLAIGGQILLRPYYPVIDQTGIDAQAFHGDWAFKFEGFSRSGFGRRYAAANIGFERTVVGAFGSRADLGLVVEYMYDERDEEAFNTLFEHDIALGGRLQLNDFADTQALLGVIFDTQRHEYLLSLEASRQLTERWLLSLEGRVFGGGEELNLAQPLQVLQFQQHKSAWLQSDDYLQLELRRFF